MQTITLTLRRPLPIKGFADAEAGSELTIYLDEHSRPVASTLNGSSSAAHLEYALHACAVEPCGELICNQFVGKPYTVEPFRCGIHETCHPEYDKPILCMGDSTECPFKEAKAGE